MNDKETKKYLNNDDSNEIYRIVHSCIVSLRDEGFSDKDILVRLPRCASIKVVESQSQLFSNRVKNTIKEGSLDFLKKYQMAIYLALVSAVAAYFGIDLAFQ